MKKILTITLIVTMIMFAGLSNVFADEEPRNCNEVCIKIGEISGKIMELRQKGVPITDLSRSFNMNVDTTRYIIVEAYKVSRVLFDDAEIIKRRVVEFQNRMYIECITNCKED